MNHSRFVLKFATDTVTTMSNEDAQSANQPRLTLYHSAVSGPSPQTTDSQPINRHRTFALALLLQLSPQLPKLAAEDVGGLSLPHACLRCGHGAWNRRLLNLLPPCSPSANPLAYCSEMLCSLGAISCNDGHLMLECRSDHQAPVVTSMPVPVIVTTSAVVSQPILSHPVASCSLNLALKYLGMVQKAAAASGQSPPGAACRG